MTKITDEPAHQVGVLPSYVEMLVSLLTILTIEYSARCLLTGSLGVGHEWVKKCFC